LGFRTVILHIRVVRIAEGQRGRPSSYLSDATHHASSAGMRDKYDVGQAMVMPGALGSLQRPRQGRARHRVYCRPTTLISNRLLCCMDSTCVVVQVASSRDRPTPRYLSRCFVNAAHRVSTAENGLAMTEIIAISCVLACRHGHAQLRTNSGRRQLLLLSISPSRFDNPISFSLVVRMYMSCVVQHFATL
jgi:hypothetical protein